MFPPLTEDQKALVESHFRLIGIGCHHFNFFAKQIDDPEGVAALGLMEAAATYNPQMGRFQSRAMVKIRSALRDAAKSARRRRSHEVDLTDLMSTFTHSLEKADDFKEAFSTRVKFLDPTTNDTFPEELAGKEWLDQYLPRIRCNTQRRIIELCRRGFSNPKIAVTLNRSLDVVANAKQTAMRKLRVYLHERGNVYAH